jgi:5-methylcytosine-specific restriction endonuclease McrA
VSRGAVETTAPTPEYPGAVKVRQRAVEPYPVHMATGRSTRNEYSWQRRTRRERARLLRETRRTGVPPLCGICHRPIDMDAEPRSRGYLTFDHVAPVSRGGDLLDGEIRPAHNSCNASRGAGRLRTDMTRRERARSDRPRTLLDW